jgi:hypothetical protein
MGEADNYKPRGYREPGPRLRAACEFDPELGAWEPVRQSSEEPMSQESVLLLYVAQAAASLRLARLAAIPDSVVDRSLYEAEKVMAGLRDCPKLGIVPDTYQPVSRDPRFVHKPLMVREGDR